MSVRGPDRSGLDPPKSALAPISVARAGEQPLKRHFRHTSGPIVVSVQENTNPQQGLFVEPNPDAVPVWQKVGRASKWCRANSSANLQRSRCCPTPTRSSHQAAQTKRSPHRRKHCHAALMCNQRNTIERDAACSGGPVRANALTMPCCGNRWQFRHRRKLLIPFDEEQLESLPPWLLLCHPPPTAPASMPHPSIYSTPPSSFLRTHAQLLAIKMSLHVSN